MCDWREARERERQTERERVKRKRQREWSEREEGRRERWRRASQKERGKQKERTREKTGLVSQKRDKGRKERERETLEETERNMADGSGIFFPPCTELMFRNYRQARTQCLPGLQKYRKLVENIFFCFL